MTKPRISIIAAIGRQNELGGKNNLLWRIPEDLKRFKALTSGHPIIMGRKTYESIGRPLPNRENIVITRNKDFRPEGVVVVCSVEEALTKAREKEKEEIFVIGGAEIYKQSLPFLTRLYLTVIDDSKPADVFFPDYSDFKKIVSSERKNYGDLKYTWLILEH